jgi:hypothetical protein
MRSRDLTMTELGFDADPEELSERSAVIAGLLWLLIGMALIAAPALVLC